MVEYDDGDKVWHTLGDVSFAADTTSAEADTVCTDEWEALELRCCITRTPLTEPARGRACAHLPHCNLSALRDYVARLRQCPYAGCDGARSGIRTLSLPICSEMLAQRLLS